MRFSPVFSLWLLVAASPARAHDDKAPLFHVHSLSLKASSTRDGRPSIRIHENRHGIQRLLREDRFESEAARDKKLALLEQARHSGLNSTGFVRLLGKAGANDAWLESDHAHVGFEPALMTTELVKNSPKGGEAEILYRLDGRLVFRERYGSVEDAEAKLRVHRRQLSFDGAEGYTSRLSFKDCRGCPSPAYLWFERGARTLPNISLETERKRRREALAENAQAAAHRH